MLTSVVNSLENNQTTMSYYDVNKLPNPTRAAAGGGGGGGGHG